VSSLDRILPFLKPIEDLLLDRHITEVMVNDGGRHVFVERDGAVEPVVYRQACRQGHRVIYRRMPRLFPELTLGDGTSRPCSPGSPAWMC
jgi:Flp pilus assembly CpaF family ATPase